MSRYLAEFVGTFALVFTIFCQAPGVSSVALWADGNGVWGPTAIAAVLMVMVYSLADVSGANFNPAVSVALGITQKMEGGWGEVGAYCIVQMFAGLFAALVASLLLVKSVNIAPALTATWWEAVLAEMLMTTMLCFVVLNVTAAKSVKGNQYYGLAIGFVIIAAAHGGGHISSGCFNPAANFGIDLVSLRLGLFWGPVYCVFNVAGGILAAVLFRVIRPDDFELVPLDVGRMGALPRYRLSEKLIAEFIGTFFLVLTAGLNVLGSSLAPVWSIAAALMVMIFALGNISGAHFNPAVTLAIFLSGRGIITPMESLFYILVQFIAGICGALTYVALEWDSFPLDPAPGFRWIHVAVAEFIFTFMLCYVVLCVATVTTYPKLSEFFGLAIAFCVVGGGIAVGPVSGGVLNPAVSLGVATSSIMQGHFWHCLPYMAFQFLAGAVAAPLFWITHPSEYYAGEKHIFHSGV